MAGTSRDNAVAERILRVAVRLFSERGYAATSTREIAEAAGVTKPMLYYYYESKEGLCRAAVQHYQQELCRDLDHIAELSLDPERELVAIMRALFDFVSGRPDFARFAFTLIFGPQGEVPGVDLKKFGDDTKNHLSRAAERACLVGVARPGSEVAFAQAIHGLTIAWIFKFLADAECALSGMLPEQIIHDLLEGFRARPR